MGSMPLPIAASNPTASAFRCAQFDEHYLSHWRSSAREEGYELEPAFAGTANRMRGHSKATDPPDSDPPESRAPRSRL